MHHTCPHHGDALVRHPVDGTTTWRCDRCEGLWLPGTVVERVVGAKPNWPVRDATSPTALRCPDDGGALRAVDADGIELDFCLHCRGLWLDRGELARILRRERDDEDDGDDLLEDLLDGCDGDAAPRARGGARKDADGDADVPSGGGSGASPPASQLSSVGPAPQQAALHAQATSPSTSNFDVERAALPGDGVASSAADGSLFDGVGDALSTAGEALGAVLSFIGDVFSF